MSMKSRFFLVQKIVFRLLTSLYSCSGNSISLLFVDVFAVPLCCRKLFKPYILLFEKCDGEYVGVNR